MVNSYTILNYAQHKTKSKENKQMTNHIITVEFKTDSQMTESQMDNLIAMISLQIEEPQDLNGEEEEWTAREISFHKTDRQTGRFIAR